MRFYQGFVVFCFLAMLVCQVQSKKRKSRGGRKDWRMERYQKMLTPMKEEIAQIQKTVGTISNPVHIHLHGVAGMDSSSLDQLAVSDDDNHGHHGHGGHDHHKHKHDHHKHKHHKHGHHGHHKKGKKGKCCGGHGSEGDKSESGATDSVDSSEEEEDNVETPNQSHVHIHLKIAGEFDGGRTETCSPQDDGYPEDEYIHACCHVLPNTAGSTTHNVRGSVYFRQKPKKAIEVKVNLDGFDNSRTDDGSSHGFHVHEFADVASGCNAFGGHFNPSGHAHGGPDHDHKHAGDWGNIRAIRGSAKTSFNATGTLYGRESMIGRGIVIHAGEDDLGQAGTPSSRTTGSAGARIACCAITHCKGVNWA